MNKASPKPEIKPDLTTPLADTPLIPPGEFHKKLRAIMSVPKEELEEQIAKNPLPPQKRGRKPAREPEGESA